MKKRIALILVAVVMCLSMVLAGCSKKPDAAPVADPDAVYTLRIGDVTAPGHPLCNTLEEMAAAINERSGGRI